MGLPTIYLNIRIVEWHMEKHMRHMNIVQWTKFTCLMDIILLYFPRIEYLARAFVLFECFQKVFFLYKRQ